MRFVKTHDFTMYHDITDGVSIGWTISFTQQYTNRGTKCVVSARSPTGRVLRSPTQVAKIFSIEDWPQFAKESLDQQVKSGSDERVF